jgi:hypothetical protein
MDYHEVTYLDYVPCIVVAVWGIHEEGVKPEAFAAATNVSVSRNTAAILPPVHCSVSKLMYYFRITKNIARFTLLTP